MAKNKLYKCSIILLFNIFAANIISAIDMEIFNVLDPQPKKLKVYDTITFKDTEFFLTEFTDNANYGLMVWKLDEDKEKSIPLWHKFFSADSEPHEFHWIDFNNDSKKDLLIFAYTESCSYTFIYLNNIKKEKYLSENFILKYEYDGDYSVMTDFDNNGIPEILDSGTREYNELYFEELSEHLSDEIIEEYFKISFESANIISDSLEYPIINMKMPYKIRIFSFKGNDVKDITKKFKKHIKWRIKILKLILKLVEKKEVRLWIIKKNGEDYPLVIEESIKYTKDLINYFHKLLKHSNGQTSK